MQIGKLEDFSVDQAAGSIVLVFGAIGGLLSVIWRSRCECSVNLCMIFRCHRKPQAVEAHSADEEEGGEALVPPPTPRVVRQDPDTVA